MNIVKGNAVRPYGKVNKKGKGKIEKVKNDCIDWKRGGNYFNH